MLASFFIVNGAKAALKPATRGEDAEPVAAKSVPLAQRLVPASVASFVPEDTASLVRLSGIAQVLGGLGLATGVARRASSAVLAVSMIPHLMAARPGIGATPADKEHARSILLRNVALLGGVLIAARDTQGQPSLGWQARNQAERLADEAARQKKILAKDVKHARKAVARQSDSLTAMAKQGFTSAQKSLESAL